MKKDLIFAPILLLIAISLFLLKLTDMPLHIVISLVGVAVLIAYTVVTKKEWKIPVLEIVMRAMYGIALISGIIINLSYVPALAVIHKVCAALFALLLIASFVYKLILETSKTTNS